MRLSYIVLCLFFPFGLYAQITAMFTPEPEAVLSGLNINTLGVWNVRVCNEGSASVSIPPEALLMQAPQVHWVESSLAVSILTQKQASSPAGKAATILTIGTGVAGLAGGWGAFAVSRAVLGDLAAASMFGNYLQGQVKALEPNISPFVNTMLQAPIGLAGGACGTYTAFADPTDSTTPVIGPTARAVSVNRKRRNKSAPPHPPIIVRFDHPSQRTAIDPDKELHDLLSKMDAAISEQQNLDGLNQTALNVPK